MVNVVSIPEIFHLSEAAFGRDYASKVSFLENCSPLKAGWLVFMKRLLALFLVSGAAFAQGPSPANSMAVIGPNADVATSSPAPDSDRLWLDLLPQATGKTTLVGGTVRNLDYVRDTVTVRVFGGRDIIVLFDDRTHFYRDGVAASARELQPGARVYVDTAMAGSDIFARNVRILSQAANGESNGRIESYDPKSGDLMVRDTLAAESARFHLDPNARILRDGHPVTNTDLQPGSLVSLKFGPSAKGPGQVREISILAEPGGQFVFAGRVTHLDLHTGLLVVMDPRDSKSYDIHFDPAMGESEERLLEGVNVTVATTFDGANYTAKSITVNPAPVK